MAKNPLWELTEQHVEKVVLGMCLLLFVVATIHWGLSSPRKVELPGVEGEKPSPSEADARLYDKARSAMGKVEAKEPNTLPTVDYVQQIHGLASASSPPQRLVMAAFGTPTAPIQATEGPQAAKLTLADLAAPIPAPGKPLVKAVRVLPNRLMDKPADELVAHVVAIYPWSQMVQAWKAQLGPAGVPCEPAAVRVEAQVQEQQPDGTWGPPREIQATYAPTLDAQNTPITPPDKVPAYDGSNGSYLVQLQATLSTAAWQAYILEPSYWQIWWPGHYWTDWTVDLPENDVTKEAASAVAAGTVAPGAPGALPGFGAPAPRPAVSRQPLGRVPENQFGEAIDDIEDIQPRGPGGGGRVGLAPVPTVPAPPPVESIPPPQLPTIPDIATQMQTGKVLVWFHDSSLQPLKTYRYRLRIQFLNPLLGFDNAVKDPASAAEPLVAGAFSDWSDPIELPQPTEFFLTGAMETQGKVTVTVFTRSTGQQVKERFTLAPGQTIGQVKEILLTNPADGSVGKVPVDFNTGALAVEVNFSRPNGLSRNVAELLYLDEKGNLQSKTDVKAMGRNDREYQRYKDLEEKEKVTRLAAEAAKAAAQPPAAPVAPQ